jgi:hypothetical protein
LTNQNQAFHFTAPLLKAMETRAYVLAQRSFMTSYLTKVLHPNKFVQAILAVPLGILLLGEKSN